MNINVFMEATKLTTLPLYLMTLNAVNCINWLISEWCPHYLLFHIVTSLDYPINYLHLVNMLHTDKYLLNILEFVQVYYPMDFVVLALVFVLLHSIYHVVRPLSLVLIYNRLMNYDDGMIHLNHVFRCRFGCHSLSLNSTRKKL